VQESLDRLQQAFRCCGMYPLFIAEVVINFQEMLGVQISQCFDKIHLGPVIFVAMDATFGFYKFL
jgi:hypothetical protein